MSVTVWGADYSVYTRIARLALAEKGVACDFQEVDVFADGGPPADHLARQPFGRIPAFRHDDLTIYETTAICRYVDDAFDGPSLTPADATPRARMNQIISIMDSYGYPSLVWDVYVERVRVPEQGGVSDEQRIAMGLERAATVLAEVTRLRGDAQWMAGGQFTLADIWVLPVLILFRIAPEGAAMLDRHPGLAPWLAAAMARPSAVATTFPIERTT